MNHLTNFSIATGLCATVAAGAAFAASHADKALLRAVNARQAHMTLYDYNAGLLFAMAKGDREYDAKVASGAANNIAALSSTDQSQIWLPGTDSESMGLETTHALPKIWESGSTVMEKAMALGEAASNLQAVAGDGLDAMKEQLGPLGKACTSCHEDNRAPYN